jgi:hypothetical protein
MRISLSLLFLTLTSCISPGRLSKLPKDIHIVEKREAIKEHKTGLNTLTIQYLRAEGSYTRPLKTVRATNVPSFFTLDAVNKLKNKAYLPWPRAVLEVKY